MNRSLLFISVLSVVLILPIVTTASVVVNSNISVNLGNTNSNPVYLTTGPGYADAHSLNYISVTGDNSASTEVAVGLNVAPGSGYTVLTNVLEIYNASKSSSHVYVYLNGTLPVGVAFYYSYDQMTYDGTNIVSSSGVTQMSVSSPNAVHLLAAGTALYISVEISDSANAAQTTLYMQYSII